MPGGCDGALIWSSNGLGAGQLQSPRIAGVGGGVAVEVGLGLDEAVGIVCVGLGLIATTRARAGNRIRLGNAIKIFESVSSYVSETIGHGPSAIAKIGNLHPFRATGVLTKNGSPLAVIAIIGKPVAGLVGDACQCVRKGGVLIVVDPLRIVVGVAWRLIRVGNGDKV